MLMCKPQSTFSLCSMSEAHLIGTNTFSSITIAVADSYKMEDDG